MRRSLLQLTVLIAVLLAGGCVLRKPGSLPPADMDPTPSATEPEAAVKETRADLSVPVEGFEQLAGWTVEGDGTPQIEKVQEEALFGKHCAELTWSMPSAGPYELRLRPSAPLVVNSVFNSVTIWLHDHLPGREQVLRLYLTDDQDVNHQLNLPYEAQEGWQLLHLRLGDSLEWPVLIKGIEFRGRALQPGERRIFMDSFACYQEQLRPIPQENDFVRPFAYAPPYAPRKDSSVLLDFPTRAEAYGPDSGGQRHMTSVEELDPEHYRFQYEGEDGQLAYRVELPEGKLPQVIPEWNGVVLEEAWSGLEVRAGEEELALRVARVEEDALQLHYANGLRITLQLRGKTLQFDLDCVSDQLEALSLGGVNLGVRDRSLIEFPMLRVSQEEPWPVFLLRGEGSGLFLSVLPDWWRSMAGRYDRGRQVGEQVSLGSMEYLARWKGRRNPLRERVYLTLSPEVEEVLPSPAAPQSLFRGDAASRMWTGAMADEQATSLCSLGVDRLFLRGERSSCASWRPARIGTLGSVSPLDEEWNEDLLSRTPDGGWVQVGDSRFAVKSSQWMTCSEDAFAELRETGNLDMMELDAGFGAFPPWERSDFDVRVNGAGTFAQVLEDTGTLLQQVAAENGGGLLGPGGSEWLHAGFYDAFISEVSGGFAELLPLRPQFTWRNLHPVSAVYGLGPLAQYVRLGEAGSEALQLDRAMALQLAYGATGRLPVAGSPRLTARAYHLLQSVHEALGGQTVERIAYWDGRGYLGSGEAFRTDVVERSQLYLRTSGDIEIWVNGQENDAWTLKLAGTQVTLPPFGFVVKGDELEVYALQGEEGGRWYAKRTDGSFFLDSPDVERSAAGMRGRGAAALQVESDRAVLHVLEWTGRWWIGREATGGDALELSSAWGPGALPMTDLEVYEGEGGWSLVGGTAPQRVEFRRSAF